MVNVLSKKMYHFIPLVLIGMIAVGLIIVISYFNTQNIKSPKPDYVAEKEPEIEEGVKTWIKAFERHGDQTIHSIQQTSDGGYIAAGIFGRTGTDTSTGHQFPDAYLLKLDSDGNKTWEKTIGVKKGSIARDIQQTSDGGYIIVGITWDYFDLDTGWDVYLVKTDENGDKMWEKVFYLFGAVRQGDSAYSVQQTSDGGYIVGGWTSAYLSTRYEDAFLLKTDEYGNKIWEKNYGGNGSERTRSAQQTSDGGYIIAGWTDSFNSTTPDDLNAYLVKTDADGNKLWERAIDAFDKHEQEEVEAMWQTSDGGYILAGSTLSVDASRDSYAYLLKVDKDGNKMWENVYAKVGTMLHSVQQTSDGGYIATGSSGAFTEESVDVYLLKTDANGNKVWEKGFVWNETYGREEDYRGYSVQQTSDGGYIIAAETHYPFSNPWQNDILLIKTDGNGNIYGYKG